MRLYRVLAEMLLDICPKKYGDKIVIEQGKKLIYEVLKHALYGVLIIYLLFWRDLVRKLKSWGFHTKPY